MRWVVNRLVMHNEPVSFRPKGNSMQPKIESGDLVRVVPRPEWCVPFVGDVVLARVKGKIYLHLVSAVDVPNQRVQISNNKGRVNGWTPLEKVFGICVEVEGREINPLSWYGGGDAR